MWPKNSVQTHPQSTCICRVQSFFWSLPKYWPPTPLSTQRVCPPPTPKKGGGVVQTRRAVRGVGGSIFWKTPDIGLASYSIISLSTDPPVHKLSNSCYGQKLHLKGHCHETIFLNVKNLIGTFCLCADGFQGLTKAFTQYTNINFLFASLKCLLILKMRTETLIRISLSVIVMLTYCAAFF